APAEGAAERPMRRNASLFLHGVADGVLHPANGVLHLAGDLIRLAFGFQLGISRHFAGSLLDLALQIGCGALDPILVHLLISTAPERSQAADNVAAGFVFPRQVDRWLEVRRGVGG